ncbi:uncharacterized protein TM35_000123220 [Trypanosoma theileri]|uniref:Uncharacterized protein n=1 Tax=Trypanosoma theileri TaxID=67003 RepID=A0A1X0NXY8_9TRYP|nr:uncharacterized protein TM35_000123220 [Trypanosoma theileri]ORC89547.1 hypothetical protein TM35_000123220 [Trypanosoma theileri]
MLLYIRVCLLLLLLLVVLFADESGISSRVLAKECSVKQGMRAWKHDGGMFLREGTTLIWHEMDKKGTRIAAFTEEMRQDGQVILRDEKRDMQILLRSDLCAMRHGNQEEFHQLYAGQFLKTVDCT